MKREYNVLHAKLPFGFNGTYKKIDNMTVINLKQIPNKMEFVSKEKSTIPVQINQKKEKLDHFLNKFKLTKFFSLNREVYNNGSKDCTNEFNFFRFNFSSVTRL